MFQKVTRRTRTCVFIAKLNVIDVGGVGATACGWEGVVALPGETSRGERVVGRVVTVIALTTEKGPGKGQGRHGDEGER